MPSGSVGRWHIPKVAIATAILVLPLAIAHQAVMHKADWDVYGPPTMDKAENSFIQKPVNPPDIRPIEQFPPSAALPDDSDKPIPSGVTIYPAPHNASKFWYRQANRHTPSTILSAVDWGKKHGDIIQSSFQQNVPDGLEPDKNGFVESVVTAYSSHHHLKIRPDDVWLAILTQLSSYINAHAEELRGSFVAHEGKKALVIKYGGGTRYTVDWGDFAYKIGLMIEDNVVDPDLRKWILPAFSTTTKHDTIVANIVMMASMQAYFEYIAVITCGFPSVNLLGEKADYELILTRLDKLRSYGREPTQFADLLTPVIKRFIRSFDDPDGDETKDFWNRALTSWNMGSGATHYTGWIAAFMYWDSDGKPLYQRRKARWAEEHLPPLTLDGVTYHVVDSNQIPQGFASVPVLIYDNGLEVSAEMLAGSIGSLCTSSGKPMDDGNVGVDTMQPMSGWWIYEAAKEDERAGWSLI